MCLLDEVLSWNATRVQCRSSTHRDASNPLRNRGCLAAVCGIEYAAQAMAVHGALIASRIAMSPKGTPSLGGAANSLLHTGTTITSSAAPGATRVVGYLASVRNVAMYVDRLDDVEGDLVATAELLTGDERSVLYDFSVSGGEGLLLAGRATIVFNAPPRELSTDPRTTE